MKSIVLQVFRIIQHNFQIAITTDLVYTRTRYSHLCTRDHKGNTTSDEKNLQKLLFAVIFALTYDNNITQGAVCK